MNTPDLGDSILFDVYAWKDYKGLQPLLDELWKEMPKDKCKKKTLGRLNTTLKLFLCNLFMAHCKNAPVAISFKAEMYSQGRYKALHFRRIPFRRVFEFLEEKKLVCTKKGVKFFERQNGATNNINGYDSRIWPSDLLTQRFNTMNVIISCDYKSIEPIILRDSKGMKIPYTSTRKINTLSNNINRINHSYLSHIFQYNLTHSDKEYIPNTLQDNYYIDINEQYNSDYNNYSNYKKNS